jgi:hypothetical protein
MYPRTASHGSGFVFGRCSVEISAETLDVLHKVFVTFLVPPAKFQDSVSNYVTTVPHYSPITKSFDVIRGIVSKQVTNGSKTAVMDVICFLCVSLGSSTVHLHDIIGSRRACACSEAGFSSENGYRA